MTVFCTVETSTVGNPDEKRIFATTGKSEDHVVGLAHLAHWVAFGWDVAVANPGPQSGGALVTAVRPPQGPPPNTHPGFPERRRPTSPPPPVGDR